MKITEAKYIKDPLANKNVSIDVTVGGIVISVPLAESNRYYVEILKQVEAGTLTIKDAD